MKRFMLIDSEIILNTLYGMSSMKKVISISFDGATTMSGSLSEVQAGFKEQNENHYLFIAIDIV